jgi:hypothetical protein
VKRTGSTTRIREHQPCPTCDECQDTENDEYEARARNQDYIRVRAPFAREPATGYVGRFWVRGPEVRVAAVVESLLRMFDIIVILTNQITLHYRACPTGNVSGHVQDQYLRVIIIVPGVMGVRLAQWG